MKFELTYKPYGQYAILVEWPAVINPDILADVLRFKSKLVCSEIRNIVEVRQAYQSLLVIYNRFELGFHDEVALLKSVYVSKNQSVTLKSTLWKVPVCYDIQFGIDLESISKVKKIPITDIIELHSQSVYTVYFIGFLPGFMYLGGLNKKLAMPRKSVPRLQIQKGSVAIGGSQTGVYPSDSPGGWNIIGNSPVDFFNKNKERPCFASAGDRIKFCPVSLKEFKEIKILVNNKEYKMEGEVVDG